MSATRTVWTTKTVDDSRALHTALTSAGISSYSYMTAKGGTPSKSSITEAPMDRVAEVAATAGIKVKLEVGVFDDRWRRLA